MWPRPTLRPPAPESHLGCGAEVQGMLSGQQVGGSRGTSPVQEVGEWEKERSQHRAVLEAQPRVPARPPATLVQRSLSGPQLTPLSDGHRGAL